MKTRFLYILGSLFFAIHCSPPKNSNPISATSSSQPISNLTEKPSSSQPNILADIPLNTTSSNAISNSQKLANESYKWLKNKEERSFFTAFPESSGFIRVKLQENSFGSFLRFLPLMPENSPVLDYRGNIIQPANASGVAAVVDLDVGTKDLQQCADTIVRLHAEWLWSKNRMEEIEYPVFGKKIISWSSWSQGARPVLSSGKNSKPGSGPTNFSMVQSKQPDSSREIFKDYLEFVFSWSGSGSMQQTCQKVQWDDLAPGDFLIQGGYPGHVVLILDVAEDSQGRRQALIGQGYMPAQEMHVLRSIDGSAWFSLDGENVKTPFWTPFNKKDLCRFKNSI